MKKIVALPATQPRSVVARNVAWVYAGVLTIMAAGQLFTFDKLVPVLEGYRLPGSHGTALLLGALLVVFEVFALPFLLRMRLSPLMRGVSLVCGALVAVIWMVLGFVAIRTHGALHNSGLLGTKVPVPAGAAEIVVALVLIVVAGVSIWGLLPRRNE